MDEDRKTQQRRLIKWGVIQIALGLVAGLHKFLKLFGPRAVEPGGPVPQHETNIKKYPPNTKSDTETEAG